MLAEVIRYSDTSYKKAKIEISEKRSFVYDVKENKVIFFGETLSGAITQEIIKPSEEHQRVLVTVHGCGSEPIFNEMLKW